MAGEATHIMCLGDLHLGRHPARIPAQYDGERMSPDYVWGESVKRAIRTDVDLVVITGDVIDLERGYYGAYGSFLEGVQQLEENGVPLVCVGGNHDAETLPRMVADVDSENVRFLGQNGSWERYTLHRDGEAVLHLDGWSFPTEHVAESPLASYDLSREDGLPHIGVVHGDLGSRESEYGPITHEQLAQTENDCWLLGHIHAPGIREEQNPLVLYPGSPQPLDPGETGPHGPWIVSVADTQNHEVEARQLPIATVRYDPYDLDLSGTNDLYDVPPRYHDKLSDVLGSDGLPQTLELMLLRVKLSGRCPFHAELSDTIQQLSEDLEARRNDTLILPETIEVDTRPAVDLEELAEGTSPAAFLAQYILALENDPSTLPSTLITDCRDAMREAYGATTYQKLRSERETPPPTSDDAADVLLEQARVLLDTLLKQKEDRS